MVNVLEEARVAEGKEGSRARHKGSGDEGGSAGEDPEGTEGGIKAHNGHK